MNNKFKKILIVTIVFLTLIFQFGIDGEKFNLNLVKAETLIEKNNRLDYGNTPLNGEKPAKGQTLADKIIALPSMEEAANYSTQEKKILRSQLIDIFNELSLLTSEERIALEDSVGIAEMVKYQDLYYEYVEKDGDEVDFLDGDWAYVSRFELVSIQDGTAPFDTSDDLNDISYKNRQGNDEGPNNGKVRSFDTISYDLFYSTSISGEYLRIKKGYLCYEFVLPHTVDKAQWELDDMIWLGIKVENKDELVNKRDGESYYFLETKKVDGVWSQVITGKKFLIATAPNPSVFPGSGTLNAVIRVLNLENNSQVQPSFKIWLEHNHLDGECLTHNRLEPKSLVANPITVTSELRLNVQLRTVASSGVSAFDTFDFSTGNDLALNKDAGNIYGRLICYGITLQLYNLDPADGLKGVAIPEGPITFDIDLNSVYKMENGEVIEDLPDKYTPLVWSYEEQSESDTQKDGRDVKGYGNTYAYAAAPHAKPAIYGRPMGYYTPKTGTNRVWNGGTWTGNQSGSKVSFTVDNYVINPNYFPNVNGGNSLHVDIYFNPENGVRSSNIGCFSGAELFIVVPFGNGEDYLPTVYGNDGLVEFSITDSNLRASSSTAGSLPVVTDNSNQTKPNKQNLPDEDDKITREVSFYSLACYENLIRYIYSTNRSLYSVIGGGTHNIGQGKHVAARGQEFAILWGGIYQAGSEKKNAVYGYNALMKFDPTGLELVGEPNVHKLGTKRIDENTTFTFLYAVKKDGKTWTDDTEMDEAVESDLLYFKTKEEAQEHGVVVGILMEARNDDPIMHNGIVIVGSVQARIKADAPTNKVYQIVERVKVWLKAQYDETENGIPRRYDFGDSVVYPDIPPHFKPDGKTAIFDDWTLEPYIKARYENGIYVDGHNGGSRIGDSVYVIPYITKIQKKVAQIVEGKEKEQFDVDANQRVVDFRLSPSIRTLAPYQNEILADVVIVDVLPKGLSYVDGSAYYGGTYIQNPISGQRGTILGGEQINPLVEKNQTTGETTLTWIIQNFVVNNPMSDIIFSAYIGEPGTVKDVVNNQYLLSKVSIEATEDKREKIERNNNYAEVGIVVSKLSTTSIAIIPDSKYVDVGEVIGWKAYVSNDGTNPYSDTVVLTVLPYNGDYGGSKFDSNAQIMLEDWSIDTSLSTLENLSEWDVFYTTDINVRGTRSQDYSADDLRGGTSTLENGNQVTWIKATLNHLTGEISGVTGNVTALAAVGTLNSSKTFIQDIKLNANPSSEAEDIFSSTLSRERNEIFAPINVIKRTLEGLMWNDANADGIRQLTEGLFDEGNVALLVQNQRGEYVPYLDAARKPVIIPLGKQIDLNTGSITPFEDGKYRFIGLPAGVFGVRFKTKDIKEYKTSPQNVGGRYIDSDAEGEYLEGILQSTIITGIDMPEKNEIASASYASKFKDAGLYLRKIEIKVEKVWDDSNDEDGTRPDSVIIRLFANGIYTNKTITLSELNEWVSTFDDLLEYDNGKLISYTVDEVTIGHGYKTSITGNMTEGYTVTNSKKFMPDNPIPGTGDYFNPTIWIMLMIVSFASLIGLIVYKNKSARKQY